MATHSSFRCKPGSRGKLHELAALDTGLRRYDGVSVNAAHTIVIICLPSPERRFGDDSC